VRAVHDHYGRIDRLVNNAGRSYAAAVEEIESELFDEMFHLNVLGPTVRHAGRYSGGASTGCGKRRKCELRNGIHGTARIQRLLLFQAGSPGFHFTARAELEKDRIIVSEIYPFIPQPNFGKNRMGNPTGGGPPANYSSGDMPEFVAGLILQAIEAGHAQYFANDRLRQLAGV
jgi:NAD(P)-dependent dehydrogenase (short-subunit alcohol dehydrogenase family)